MVAPAALPSSQRIQHARSTAFPQRVVPLGTAPSCPAMAAASGRRVGAWVDCEAWPSFFCWELCTRGAVQWGVQPQLHFLEEHRSLPQRSLQCVCLQAAPEVPGWAHTITHPHSTPVCVHVCVACTHPPVFLRDGPSQTTFHSHKGVLQGSTCWFQHCRPCLD